MFNGLARPGEQHSAYPVCTCCLSGMGRQRPKPAARHCGGTCKYWPPHDGGTSSPSPAVSRPVLADTASLPQSAGARAVPIVYDAPLEEITQTVSKLNALLLPGGGAPITPGHRFYDTVAHLLNLTVQANDAGEHFAVRRTAAQERVGWDSCVPVHAAVSAGPRTTPAHAWCSETCWDKVALSAGRCMRAYEVADTWTSRSQRGCSMPPPAVQSR